MNVLASARIAVRALRVNQLRSALTMLGIVIGVGAVITMVAVGSGAQARVAEQIQSLGSNMIIVLSGSVVSGGVRMGSGSQLTITEDDAWAIQREIRTVAAAAPTSRGGAQVVYGNLNWATSVQGVTHEFFTAREWDVADGRLFSQEEVEGAAKVALIGQTVAGNLFGEGDPLGQIIRIKNVPFGVIGVLQRKGQTTFGQDQDDTVLIPLSTAKKKVLGSSQANARAVGSIAVKVGSAAMQDAEQRSAACSASGTACSLPGRRLHDPQSDRGAAVAGGLVGCSRAARRHRLGVAAGGRHRHHEHHAGVGDRADREIGLRMAVGAAARHPGAVPGGGGDPVAHRRVLGIALGLGGSYAIAYFAQWRTLVSVEAVVAFAFSAAVGVFFGFYPARKASRLNPIDALRYE